MKSMSKEIKATCHDCGHDLTTYAGKCDEMSSSMWVKPCEKCTQEVKRQFFQDGYAAGQMEGYVEKKPRKLNF